MGISLKEMQQIELEMLKELHKFMIQNNLRYYLIGGTLLGAVRHSGFIPWDDDIDIAMPRKDFERFIELSEHLTKPLTLKFFHNTKPYVYPFAKVENMNTHLVEAAVKHLNISSGVYIDVFPFDGVPQKWLIRKLHIIRIRLMVIIRLFCCVDKKKERNLFKRLGALLVQQFVAIDWIVKELDRVMKKYDYDECDIIANYAGAWGNREIVPKSYIGKPLACVFENAEFLGVEKPHEYLSRVYGDYMKLPPEEKRCSHHKYEAYLIEQLED